MLETNRQLEKRGPSPVLWILLAAAAVAGGGVYWLQEKALEPPEAAGDEITEEARAYLPNLELSPDTGMAAKQDALGQTLLEITGSITNHGERVCEIVEVNVVFREVNGLEIDRQRAAIVGRRTGALEPGETQEFRLPFDNLAPEWNQAFPSLFISRIEFQ